MLQLVQAFRYEYFQNSPLRKFLLNRAVRDETIAYTLHWHVNLEQNNEENGEMIQHYQELYQSMMNMLKQDAS